MSRISSTHQSEPFEFEAIGWDPSSIPRSFELQYMRNIEVKKYDLQTSSLRRVKMKMWTVAQRRAWHIGTNATSKQTLVAFNWLTLLASTLLSIKKFSELTHTLKSPIDTIFHKFDCGRMLTFWTNPAVKVAYFRQNDHQRTWTQKQMHRDIVQSKPFRRSREWIHKQLLEHRRVWVRTHWSFITGADWVMRH